MPHENQTQQKRTTSASRSILQSQPASAVKPLLAVLLSALALIALGLVMVYSSSSITSLVEAGDANSEALKQVLFALVGILLAIVVARLSEDSALIGWMCWLGWGLSIALIAATALVGTVGLGAQRWLVIGGVSIQASEFAKIAFVLMGARIITKYQNGEFSTRKACLEYLGFVVAPIAFVLITQSDLGTAVICGVSVLVMLWLAGLNYRYIIALVVVCVAIGVFMIYSSPYRMARFTTFLDPWADPQGSGYQLVHSFKALAAGGVTGVGIGNSYEKMLYLPEAETDFIYAIIGEEMGLIGTIGVLALFLVFLIGAIKVSGLAQCQSSMLIASTLGIMLVAQAFLNMACVIGFAPVTGKPLPFISSGGSSMISSCLIVGIIVGIWLHAGDNSTSRQRRDDLHVVSAYNPTHQTARRPMRRVQATNSRNETPAKRQQSWPVYTPRR